MASSLMHSALREYVIVGAGPAAMCAIAKLIALGGVEKEKLAWIDPDFQLGAFGTSLSAGSSVPGNTDVESYVKVINGIAALIPSCHVPEEVWRTFDIAGLEITDRVKTCPIKIAAQPLKYVADRLAGLATTFRDLVTDITGAKDEVNGDPVLHVSLHSGASICTRRVILATGSEPRTLSLPPHLKMVEPNTAFIRSELDALVQKDLLTLPANSTLRFAVVGSSHSAALAVMNILNAGVSVKQFANKAYKFASKQIAADGSTFTQFDNTGLKGDVAAFTRELLARKLGLTSGEDLEKYNESDTSSSIARLWSYSIGSGNIDPVELSDCTHSVVCVGYNPCNALTIDKRPLSEFTYNPVTSAIIPAAATTNDGSLMAGIFGIGIAFPKPVRSPSGETEFAVGVGKFWASVDQELLDQWKSNPYR